MTPEASVAGVCDPEATRLGQLPEAAAGVCTRKQHDSSCTGAWHPATEEDKDGGLCKALSHPTRKLHGTLPAFTLRTAIPRDGGSEARGQVQQEARRRHALTWGKLEATDGKKYAFADWKDKDVLVVVFTAIVASSRELRRPPDRFRGGVPREGRVRRDQRNTGRPMLPAMKERANDKKFGFTYLYDPSQKTAGLRCDVHTRMLRAE